MVAKFARPLLLAFFFSLGTSFLVGCAEEEKSPVTEEVKEERRQKEKEMMHREMNNK